MNLLKGWIIRDGGGQLEQALEWIPDQQLAGEPSLSEILSDPVVQLVMQRDHVTRDEIERIFRREHARKVAA